MASYRNVSPQGDQVIEGRLVAFEEEFETDADLSANPNFEQVETTPASVDTSSKPSMSSSEGNE